MPWAVITWSSSSHFLPIEVTSSTRARYQVFFMSIMYDFCSAAVMLELCVIL